MTTVETETEQALGVISRVEKLELVASSMPEKDTARQTLLSVAQEMLLVARPLRPVIAAAVLDLSEKTIRAWVSEGVLRTAELKPRLLLDPESVHAVLHVLRSVRATGKTTGLLDEVHRRLADETWLKREDLAESLDQMRRGEGTVRSPKLNA